MCGSENPGRRRRLIICMQDKGGCGRSTCASLLVDWFRRNGIHVALFERADRRGPLGSIYGPGGFAPLSPGSRYDVIDWSDPTMAICNLDEIVRCLGVDRLAEVDVSVLDASADATALLLHWFRETRISSVTRQFGIGVTIVIPVDVTADAARNAEALMCEFDSSVAGLVMRNAKGRERIPWDERVSEARNAHPNLLEIEIPSFGEPVCAYLEMQAFRGRRVSLFGATDCPDVVVAMQARRCVALMEEALATVSPVLMPAGLARSDTVTGAGC